jgi:hypothetical protein
VSPFDPTPNPDTGYAAYVVQGGALAEAEYDQLLPTATAAVDEAIWPNVVDTATQEAYDHAVYAVIDALAAGGGVVDHGGVTSEQVGRTQTTYATANVLAMAGLTTSPVYAAIRRHLSGTGLLYRGI